MLSANQIAVSQAVEIFEKIFEIILGCAAKPALESLIRSTLRNRF